jgi:hypothetical protein
MLNKSVFIAVDNLRPNTFDEGVIIREVLDTMVCCQIRKNLTQQAYDDLIVCYNYDPYSVDLCSNNITNFQLTCADEIELRKINAIVDSVIEEAIDEFYIHHKYDPNSVLNINSCLLNKNNFIVSVEVLKKRG